MHYTNNLYKLYPYIAHLYTYCIHNHYNIILHSTYIHINLFHAFIHIYQSYSSAHTKVPSQSHIHYFPLMFPLYTIIPTINTCSKLITFPTSLMHNIVVSLCTYCIHYHILHYLSYTLASPYKSYTYVHT